MTFGQKIVDARTALGYTQKDLAEDLGITATRLNYWEKDKREPDVNMIKLLAEKLHVSADYLIGNPRTDDAFQLSASERKHIETYRTLDDHGKDMVDSVLQKESDRIVQASKIVPLFETEVLMDFTTPVSAGAGIIFEKAEHNDLEVVSNIYTRKADYTLTVSGNSMLPRFKDGDRILVQETEWIEIGEIGVFWYDGRSYVKQLGHNRLISLNPDYHDIYLENYFETRCEGRVIGVLDPDWIVK